jgi:hypothetical protein
LTLLITATRTECSTAPPTLLTSSLFDLIIAARPSSISNLSSDLCFDRISGDDEDAAEEGRRSVLEGSGKAEPAEKVRGWGWEGWVQGETSFSFRFFLSQLDDGRSAMKRSSSCVNVDDSLITRRPTSFLLLESDAASAFIDSSPFKRSVEWEGKSLERC